MDNIIAALGQSNRIRKIYLNLVDHQLEEVLAAMQVPFPELTVLDLELWSDGETPPVNPDLFLGGSAPLTSAILQFVWHSISGIAKIPFVCCSPCLA
jgi:hypothetical protein